MNNLITPATPIHDALAGAASDGGAISVNEQEVGSAAHEDWPPPPQELYNLIERCLDDLPGNEYEAKAILSLMFVDANPEKQTLHDLLKELVIVFGGAALSVSDMVDEAANETSTSERLTNILYDIDDTGWAGPDWRTLEAWLEEHAGEEVGGLVLIRSMDSAVQRRWRVLSVSCIAMPAEVDHDLLADELYARLADVRDALAEDTELTDLIAELEADAVADSKKRASLQ